MGLVHMLDEEHYTYIIFPIAIIVGCAFSFFDQDDREYLRRNGIDPNEFSAFFDNEEYYNRKSTRHYDTFSQKNVYTPSTGEAIFGNFFSRDLPYKNIAKKCKRNFKITIKKD
jgi:hypothetical protein